MYVAELLFGRYGSVAIKKWHVVPVLQWHPHIACTQLSCACSSVIRCVLLQKGGHRRCSRIIVAPCLTVACDAVISTCKAELRLMSCCLTYPIFYDKHLPSRGSAHVGLESIVYSAAAASTIAPSAGFRSDAPVEQPRFRNGRHMIAQKSAVS